MSPHPSRTAERLTADLDLVRHRVDAYLTDLFDRALRDSETVLDAGSPGLEPLRTMALSGGKRIRPAFVHWGFVAAGGDPDDGCAVEAGAVVELLHLFALVHDDVMDESPTRRSAPTIQVLFADRHRSLGLRGQAQRYGENMAILLGDFALLTCTELLLSLPRRAQRLFYRAANQLMLGQYLDLENAAAPAVDDETASRTALLKTASYTVEGPLLVGAALTSRGPELDPYLRAYGRAVGLAFQYRDDLLDVFGDEWETGKPVAGDVTHQKATRLLAGLRHQAAGGDRTLLLPGEPAVADLESLRSLLLRTGAVDEVETLIGDLVGEAVTAITAAPITASSRDVLIDAAHFAGARRW
ncbi:geranylgeranyl diphosphate synthase, type I [Lentzea fradiae]|uniref:Geranylgeranyl diphosphate synthase, type I n=1 Tax=Lentzea fradiae TaxID=200378 RepID=A0A1G7UUM8_9PSEU|nr:polyprenyl synthetase family protein [Lentzea fradiae]SDG51315.1 geranylgeranyl diphosphate synthase, type I [Lentzea fradiae]